MSRAAIAFAVAAVLGVAGLAVVAAGDDRDLAFTLGVRPSLVAAELGPGDVACQRPIAVAEDFDGVRFQVGTYERPGQPLRVTVLRAGRGPIAAGRLAAGYPDVSQPTVDLDRAVASGQTVSVCVRNAGDRRVALYGNAEAAARDSTAAIDGQPVPTDLTLELTRDSRTALEAVPTMFERASLFRPGWVGPWTFWALVALLLVVAPAALARALGRAFSDER